MSRACARAATTGQRFYLYGGRNQGALVQLALNLRRRYPGLKIVGGYSPPHRSLTADEHDAVVEEINQSRADVVWVGIGVPKQEKWMAAFRDSLDAPVLIGVGAAFDFHAGLVPQAPNWLQEAGLEWAYRLAHEPRRLWRRYLRYNPRFVIAFARQLSRTMRRRATEPRVVRVADAPAASIVIPTRGRTDYLDVALASVVPQAAEAPARRCSSSATASTPLRGRSPSGAARRFWSFPGESGLNAVRNAGFAATSGEIVVLIDDDVEAPAGWLAALLEGVARAPEHDVFGGPIRARLEGGGPHGCGREPAPITTLDLGAADRDVTLVWGANMAIRRRAFERVGGFDEAISGRGDEEEWERRYTARGRARSLPRRRRSRSPTHARGLDLLALARAAYRLGRTARRYDVRKGAAPPLRGELRTLAGCVCHVLRRRCAIGIVLAAHAAGRLREALSEPWAERPDRPAR